MPTIKDIAKAAGVSHATVSNVLTHKGNVSAEKVKLVQDTARAMGYRINEAASALRSGKARIMAVILPDIQSEAHSDLYKALYHAATERGYGVMLRVTDNVPELERTAIQDVLSARAECVAVVSSLPDPWGWYAPLRQSGARVQLALRAAPDAEQRFIGFDLGQAAAALAHRLRRESARRVGLMTNMLSYPAERLFHDAFLNALGALPVQTVQSIATLYIKQAFELLAGETPDAIVTTCEEMARAVLRAADCLAIPTPRVYTLSAARVLPSTRYQVYQLNYRALGQAIGEHLLTPGDTAALVLPAAGFTDATPDRHLHTGALHLLSIDNPYTDALRRLTPMLKKETGLDLTITTLPTAEVTQALAVPESLAGFDLIRIDIALMDCYARPLFVPLSNLMGTLPELAAEFALIDGQPFAVPFDPSCQLLFYRRDLFENPRFQRAYQEQHHQPLLVPTSYEEYAKIATFFDEVPETQARGALITRQASECIAHFVAMSPDGVWPELTPETMTAYVHTRRRLENAALIAKDENWNNTVDHFARGESAMLIAHANYGERLSHNPLFQMSGRIGYATPPGQHPLLGGGVLGISRHSAQQDAAQAFLAWLYSEKTSLLMALLGGSSPCAVAYANEEALDMYPWLPVVRAGFSRGVRRRIFPLAHRPFHQLHLEEQISLACTSAISGAITPAQALAAIQAVYPGRREAP